MFKPEPLKAFDMMYRRLTADGRGEALFGGRGERLRSAYEQTLIGDECPVVYLEIPLSGKPYCDMTALLSSIPADAAFAPGRGYGLERVFRWWRSRPEPVGCCGVEVDVKGDGPLRAAAILQHDGKRDQIGPFLHALGAGDRLADYFAFCERLPGDWSDVYVGVFTGRPGAPMRVAALLAGTAKVAPLAEQLRRVGFTAFDETMARQCASFFAPEGATELQFDLLPDGRVGDALGVIRFFTDLDVTRHASYMRTDRGAAFMAALEADGLIDGRWRLLPDCCFARGRRIPDEDGGALLFSFMTKIHSVKLKYAAGVLQGVKCYLEWKTNIVEERGDEGGSAHHGREL